MCVGMSGTHATEDTTKPGASRHTTGKHVYMVALAVTVRSSIQVFTAGPGSRFSSAHLLRSEAADVATEGLGALPVEGRVIRKDVAWRKCQPKEGGRKCQPKEGSANPRRTRPQEVPRTWYRGPLLDLPQAGRANSAEQGR